MRIASLYTLAALLLSAILHLAGCGKPAETGTETAAADAGHQAIAQADAVAVDPVGRLRSASCAECHEEAHGDWLDSHHGRANRPVDIALDRGAFEPARQVKFGSVESELRMEDGKPVVQTLGPDGKITPFSPDMVLAYHPLRQYLIPFEGGRWQVTDLAYDPDKDEWFNVYGDEDRRPHEWGSWSNRGMNWNAQCAYCHVTHFEKNYDAGTDAYTSTWLEQGVSCVQCHGDMPGHEQAVDKPGYVKPETDNTLMMETCAACHSRRGELTRNVPFRTGDRYHEHFMLEMPARDGLYYADGQIRDEVYVYASFLHSRMGNAGVTCLDCHDPHTMQLKLPVENNALCMTCHAAPGLDDATVIEPMAHSFHEADSTGNRCVECHMTHTTYMQRDPRRDHGFTIPDPLMTKELGIPNACNKCHDDKSTDWTLEHYEQWYGEKRAQDGRRDRTRAVHAAYQGDPEALPGLMEAYKREDIPAWRATLLEIMSAYAGDPQLAPLAQEAASSPFNLIRSASASILSRQPGGIPKLRELLEDPVRSVRVAAAIRAMGEVKPESAAGSDLQVFLEHTGDQPGGVLTAAQYAFYQGNSGEAEKLFKRAISMDPYSAGLHADYALFLNQLGRNEEAANELAQADVVDPENPDWKYRQALVVAELGRMDEAQQLLAEIVEKFPGFHRAAYNLGLLHAQKNELEQAARILAHAASVAPDIPDYPYALATIYLRMNDMQSAMGALQKILQIDPEYPPALQLMESLGLQMTTPAQLKQMRGVLNQDAE